MKKFYILILVSVSSLFAKAQHTLTPAFNPAIGDIESYIQLTPTGLFIGSSGTSQTWNYTGISTGLNTPASNTYVAMSSVPNNFLFPTGTIAADRGSGNYNVNCNTSSKFEFLGSAAPSASNCQVYADPITFYPLPFSYGMSSTDSFSSTVSGFTVTGTFTTTGDGTGTLQLPSSTYPNVLKVTYFVFETLNSGTSIDTYTIIQSQYYSALSKFPILTIGTQTSSTSGVITYGQINTPFALGIPSTFETSGPKFYPNPVINGELFVNDAKCDVQSVSFFNNLGQSVKTISFKNTCIENQVIDVNELNKGIYNLQIETKEGIRSKKIIIE